MNNRELRPCFGILCGDGLNCENETALAVRAAGGRPKKIHVNQFLENPKLLNECEALILPGGFSFGDHLGSGVILALKIQEQLGKELKTWFDRERPILGICNGFQVLVQMGFFGPDVDLAPNRQGHFIDRWVEVKVNPQVPCVWTQKLPHNGFWLPIRHGEGRLVAKETAAVNIPLNYLVDVNGSLHKGAALCDGSGLVMGLMPHPEAALHQATHPFPLSAKAKSFDWGRGINFFRSGVHYLQTRVHL